MAPERTEPRESVAERATVQHALSRGYVQPDQLQAAVRQRDDAVARGQSAQLLAILSNRYLTPPHAQELALVYQRHLSGSGQGPVEPHLSASAPAAGGGPGNTMPLPPRRPSDRYPPQPAVQHPSRTQVESDDTHTHMAFSGDATVKTSSSSGPLESIGGYTVLRELARGGMGVVYVGQKPGLDRKVAIKVLLNAELASAEDVERFKIEAQATARLKHEGLVTVYDVGEDAGRPFIVMELVEGESLKARLLREGPLAPREAAALTQKLAKAVFYAHKLSVLHRDLKPSNVLLGADGEPKITDFGLAKDMRQQESGERGLTMTGDVMGTPAYMPPEQATGELDQIDRRSDVYSLGATLYEMLTGRPPFEGSTPMRILSAVMVDEPTPPGTVRPGLDVDLETICLKCLEKRPDDRYRSARALADDLGLYLSHRPIRARPPTLRERLDKWLQRNRGLAVAISALLVLAGLASVGGAYWLGQQQQAQRDAELRAQADAQQAAAVAAEAAQTKARAEWIGQARAATEAAAQALSAGDAEPLEARLGLALTLLQASSRWDALANEAAGDAPADVEARAQAHRAGEQLGDVAFAAGAWSLAEAAYAQLPAEQAAERSARVASARTIERLLQASEGDMSQDERRELLQRLSLAIGELPIADSVPLILRRLRDVTRRLRSDRNAVILYCAGGQGIERDVMREALVQDAERPVEERLVEFHPTYQAELREALTGLSRAGIEPFSEVANRVFRQLLLASLACVRALGELPGDGPLDEATQAEVREALLEFAAAHWALEDYEARERAAFARYGALERVEAALRARRDQSFLGRRLPGPEPARPATPEPRPTPAGRQPADWFMDRGSAALAEGRLQDAMDLTNDGLRQHRDHPDLLVLKIQVLAGAKQFDDALRVCDQALRAHPRDGWVHKNVGITLAMAGRPADAVAALTTALELVPEDPYPLLVRSNAHQELGRIDLAKADLRAFLGRAPADDPRRASAQRSLRVLESRD